MPEIRKTAAMTRLRDHVRRAAVLTSVLVALTACSNTSSTSSTTTTTPGASTDQGAKRDVATKPSVVFASGQDDVDTYRIPSIAVTADGTIVVVAEARSVSPLDTDPHHLVAKRSTDGGRTWGPLIQVAPQDTPKKGCYPSDPVLTSETGGDATGDLVVVFHPCRDGGGLYQSRSTDGGKTWSAMRPLSLAPVTDVTAAQIDRFRSGPGNGIVLRGGAAKGRLAMVADTGLVPGKTTVAVLLSDDGGKTWRIGAHATSGDATADPDESAIAALADGRLLVSSRNAAAGTTNRLQMLVSADGTRVEPAPDGNEVAPTADLGVPGVQGSMLTLPTRGEVVFASPSDPKTRRGLRLWTATDAATWKPGPVVVPGPAAYSGLVRLDDKTIGLVVETGRFNPYQRIEFVPVPDVTLHTRGSLAPDTIDPADAAAGRLVVDGHRYPVTRFCLVAKTIELDGGSIAIDVSKGLQAVQVDAKLDAEKGRPAIAFSGTVAVDMANGISFRGTLRDDHGKAHRVDLVIVNTQACR